MEVEKGDYQISSPRVVRPRARAPVAVSSSKGLLSGESLIYEGVVSNKKYENLLM